VDLVTIGETMCGINGFSWEDRSKISQMNEITNNRGPDDRGIYCDPSISLGHTRLSIIDLSDKGHQPMSNEDQSLWLIFNGEIYNFYDLRADLIAKGHAFKSNTDTEVIIHAYEEYGLDFVKMFNGMWAFCLYDKQKKILILGRDQFGIKPLYYFMDETKIIFSSMITAILCHNISISPNDCAIMEYLAYNLEDHDSYTFFTDIYRVPQDSLLIYNLTEKTSELFPWYSPLLRTEVDINTIRDRFNESIRLRTISDVPVGCCLSGGVDSSAIVCILNDLLGYTFNTYSLIAPGFSLDESKYIKEVGMKTDVQQYCTQISEDNFLSEFKDFVQSQEEPVTGMSPYAQYRVMKLAHQNGTKVLLDGQGGDEIFAGYVYYYSYYFYELLVNLKLITLGKEMLQYSKNLRDYYPHKMLAFLLLPDFVKPAVWKALSECWLNHKYLEEKVPRRMEPRWGRMTLRESLNLTLYSTAIPHLLRWEDKNSMRWSIESRPPFLDVHLVEAAMSLPSESKLKNGRTKSIFKEAIADCLPSLILERKDKIGFAAPSDDLFRKEKIVMFCNEIIYSDRFRNRPYWNWVKVEEQYNQHIQGTINIGDTIWKWINLEIWLREFFDQKNSEYCQLSYPSRLA